MKSFEFRKLVEQGKIPLPNSMRKKKSNKSSLDLCFDENAPKKEKRHKYNAKKTIIHGIVFDSKAEAERYIFLKEKERNKEITNLELQKKYSLEVNDLLIASYISDFYYYCNIKNKWVLEDVKGMVTPVYRLKKKLMKAIHGIDIVEIKK